MHKSDSAYATMSSSVLTSFHFKVVGQQLVLSVAEGEGHEGEQQGVQDANDAEDEGPAHRAVAQRVLVRTLPAHALHLRRVPAVRVD